MLENRDTFFYHLDRLLPRQIRFFPYLCALVYFRVFIKLAFGLNVKVWNRNSTKFNTFIFGVSDLDLTVVYYHHFNYELFNQIIHISKKIFIFIGEVNLYRASDLASLFPLINHYELSRDLDLVKNFYSEKERLFDKTDKIVFLQRMLFSDYNTLKSKTLLRQKKWNAHLKLLKISTIDKYINDDSVLRHLVSFLDDPEVAYQSVKNYLDVKGGNSREFFYLAPHTLSYKNLIEDSFLGPKLSDGQKMIMKRQIEWEFWGLYTQRHWLPKDQSVNHLNNLSNFYYKNTGVDFSYLTKIIVEKL